MFISRVWRPGQLGGLRSFLGPVIASPVTLTTFSLRNPIKECHSRVWSQKHDLWSPSATTASVTLDPNSHSPLVKYTGFTMELILRSLSQPNQEPNQFALFRSVASFQKKGTRSWLKLAVFYITKDWIFGARS